MATLVFRKSLPLRLTAEGEERAVPCEVTVHEVAEPYSLHILIETGETSAQKTIDSSDLARELRAWVSSAEEGTGCLSMSAKVEKAMTKYVRFGNSIPLDGHLP